MSLEWGSTPVSDLMLDATGAPTAETDLLTALRTAQRTLRSEPGAFYTLELARSVHAVWQSRKPACDTLLRERLSGRLTIEAAPAPETSMRRR